MRVLRTHCAWRVIVEGGGVVFDFSGKCAAFVRERYGSLL